MIAPPSFDTLKIAQDLKHAGFTEQQAEALTDAIKAAFTDTVATKADLQTVPQGRPPDPQGRGPDRRNHPQGRPPGSWRADGSDGSAAQCTNQFQGLYKQLWLGALGIVTAVVALVKLL